MTDRNRKFRQKDISTDPPTLNTQKLLEHDKLYKPLPPLNRFFLKIQKKSEEDQVIFKNLYIFNTLILDRNKPFKNMFIRLWHIYYDGFSHLPKWGKILIAIVVAKLLVLFVVFKFLLMPNYLNTTYTTEQEKSNHVLNELITRINHYNFGRMVTLAICDDRHLPLHVRTSHSGVILSTGYYGNHVGQDR